ncbi:MAG TPA: FAD:protein FMN transferase [Gammaproteobacteria bacterium]|nr:FAD:protein FMN transferase [Gammaproteobacteria bacterium]
MRSRFCALLFASCALLLAACSQRLPPQAGFEGFTMGTSYSVRLAGLSAWFDLYALQRGVQRRLEEVDARMSTYRADSELSRFNRNPSTDWVPASPELVRVIAEAQRISALSDGAFDVTVAPLVDLWGFGPEPGEDRVPEEAAIRGALARVGYRKLHVRRQPPALKKDRGDLHVDLSAIAKGYAVDVVADYLSAQGVDDYLVEVGGEMRASGHKAGGQPWRIGIERPQPGQRSVYAVVALSDVAVATSGDYRNYFRQQGRLYSHTIDPRTGRPVSHHLASVTVLAASSMYADGMATALDVLGPGAGFELAEREGLVAFFIVRTEKGFEDRATRAFARYSLERRPAGD